jgi:hypothetical protein
MCVINDAASGNSSASLVRRTLPPISTTMPSNPCGERSLYVAEKMRMTQMSNVADKWPILRIAAGVTLVFFCSAPVVWLVSNFLVSSVRSLGGF